MIRLETGEKIKRLLTDDGRKIKRLLTDGGEVVYKSEQPITLSVNVINGGGYGVETLNTNRKDYVIPKGITEAILTAVNLSTPYGTAYGYIYLNGALKAQASNYYYVGDVPGFGVTPAAVPQTWPVKAGDVVRLEVRGYNDLNVSDRPQTTYLDVFLTLS